MSKSDLNIVQVSKLLALSAETKDAVKNLNSFVYKARSEGLSVSIGQEKFSQTPDLDVTYYQTILY